MTPERTHGGGAMRSGSDTRDTQCGDPSILSAINAVAGVAIILVLVHLVPLLFASAAMLRVLHSE